MPERSKDWLDQAERDLGRAKLDIDHAYYEWACFVSQQAAEKAIKAVFQGLNRSVRGHGILKMLNVLQDEIEPRGAPEALFHYARVLDRYYIEARYPNGFPSGKPADYFDQTLAEEAVNAAEKIIRFCRGYLDRQAGPPE